VQFLCRTRREADRQQIHTVALLPQVADADSQERSARRWPRGGTTSRTEASDYFDGAQEIALVGMERRAGFDLKPVLTAIGAELRRLHSDVLSEPLPDRIAELLRQLDQRKVSSQDTNST
jgi:hypothetical protein